MTEIWLQIVGGWLGLYEVSSLGRVREINGHRICGQWPSPRGYMRVRLARPRRVVDVHRLVAIAFVPNPDGRPNINHIDCNTSNNVDSNLEWCTQRENLAHAERLGRITRGYGARSKRRPAPPVAEPPTEQAPGHTDLMVSPESIDAFVEANPLPDEPIVADKREVK